MLFNVSSFDTLELKKGIGVSILLLIAHLLVLMFPFVNQLQFVSYARLFDFYLAFLVAVSSIMLSRHFSEAILILELKTVMDEKNKCIVI